MDKSVIILEINCETDFVAKDENFLNFTDSVLDVIDTQDPADVEALMGLSVGGQTIEEANQQLIAKIGEKITVRRFEKLSFRGSSW